MNAAYAAAGQGTGFICNILILKLLTTTLAPLDFGFYALGMAAVGGFNSLVSGPISQAAWRYYLIFQKKQQLDDYFGAVGILTRLALVASAAVLAVAFGSSLLGSRWAGVLMFGAIQGAFTTFTLLYTTLLIVAGYGRVASLFYMLDPGLKLTVVWLLSVSGRASTIDEITVFMALSGASLLILLLQTWISRTLIPQSGRLMKLRLAASPEYTRHLKRYAAGFTGLAAFNAFSLYGDRWLIGVLLTVEEAGIYAALMQIASAPMILASNVTNQLFLTRIFAEAPKTGKVGAGKQTAFLEATFFYIAPCAAFLVLCLFLGEQLLRFFTNDAIARRADWLVILVLAMLMFYMGQLLANKFLVQKRPDKLLLPKLLHATLLAFGGTIAIVYFGVAGLVWTALAAAAFYLIAVAVRR